MQTIKRAFIWFRIYSVELHIDGCNEALDCVSDPAYINRIHESRMTAKRELHRLRGIQRGLRMANNKWRTA